MMRNMIALVAAAGLVAAGSAFAGLNAEFPLLPTATYTTGVTFANNQGSSMCADCHSRIPQTTGGTHFVATDLSGDTRSSGGWARGAGRQATARNNAEAGEYFAYRVNDGGTGDYWSSAGYSKYFDGTNSVIVPSAVADVGDDNVTTPWVDTGAPDFATSIAGGANPAAYDVICESCHSIIVNVAGGNNLLEDVTDDLTAWSQDASEATLCVGCHGFMYSADANDNSGTTGGIAQNLNAANGADNNWNDYRNFTDDSNSTRRGNAEDRTVYGAIYQQNHHVMTGDDISVVKVNNAYPWRDVLSLSADAVRTVDNTSTVGQYTVDGNWVDLKAVPTAATDLNCLNCHAPGHGNRNGTTVADVSVGASILRDTNLAGKAADAIERIGVGTRGWMTITDNLYCNNCHHLPGGSASN